MIRKIANTIFFVFFIGRLAAQVDSGALFDIQQPLNIKLSLSVKEVRKSKEDTEYLSHKLHYLNASGVYDSINVGLKGRGNSRAQLCYFIPLWIKIEKKDAKGNLFQGNKKLKLVVPCSQQKGSNDLVLREYLCFKLYEIVSRYAFKTRLVNIDLTEIRGNKKSNYSQKGILLEDIDNTAKRFDAKPMKNAKVTPGAFQDTMALRFDLFQFMIANTDWSKSFQHNCKLIYREPDIIPIPYDFDMSGLVDAYYAQVSQINGEQLPITSVRDRYYRGDCRSNETTEFVRNEFLEKEEKFMSLPDELKGELPDKQIKEIKNYLQDFFTILKKDNLFKSQILYKCRSMN